MKTSFPSRIPFKPTSFAGFYFMASLHTVETVAYVTQVIATVSIHVGICIYVDGCFSDLKEIVNEMSDISTESEKETKLRLLLIDMIKLHNDTLM